MMDAHRSILVPVDGTDASKHAVDCAIMFARALRSPIRLLAVVDLSALGPKLGMSPLLRHTVESAARERVDDGVKRAAAADVPATGHVRHGDARQILVDHAVESALVVLGRSHRSALDRTIGGNFGRAFTAHCPVPMVVVGSDAPVAVPSTVQVLVDGSTAGDRAAAWAVRLAGAVGAAVELVSSGKEATAILDAVADRVPGCAGARTSVMTGPVVDGLLDHAEATKPSVVVIGRTGATLRRRVFEGSVVRGFTEHCPAPLVIAP